MKFLRIGAFAMPLQRGEVQGYDLDGWSETKDGKTFRHAGILGRFRVSRKDCEAMIINASIKAGWIE